jgi:hypothetical protein
MRAFSPRLMTIFLALLLACGGALHWGFVQAQPSGEACPPGALKAAPSRAIAIQVRYRGNIPRRVNAETSGGPYICLRHEPDFERFVGNYPVSPRLLSVTIVAEFYGERPLAVPLEPGYRSTPLVFALPLPEKTPCRLNAVNRLRMDAGSRDAALQAAYQARYWYRDSNDCPNSLKGDVARIWFDRSFEATRREDAFVIDMESAHALVHERPGDLNYVRGMLGRYNERQAGKSYRHQNALQQGGWVIDAIQANGAMLVAIATNKSIADLYAGVSITPGRLKEDRAYFIARSGLDKAAVEAIAREANSRPAEIWVAGDLRNFEEM